MSDDVQPSQVLAPKTRPCFSAPEYPHIEIVLLRDNDDFQRLGVELASMQCLRCGWHEFIEGERDEADVMAMMLPHVDCNK